MKKTIRVLGIDPGKTGAISLVTKTDKYSAYAIEMPMIGKGKGSTLDIIEVEAFIKYASVDMICIEKVHAMPKQGVVSMFEFGKVYGSLLAIATLTKVPLIIVTPQEWKRVILMSYDKKDKYSSVKYCKNIFPQTSLRRTDKSYKDDHNIADAICIAMYGIKDYEKIGFPENEKR